MTKLVETLLYKPDGRGFDSRLGDNPYGRTMVLGWTHLLTEMSTTGQGGGWVGLTILPFLCADCLKIVGT